MYFDPLRTQIFLVTPGIEGDAAGTNMNACAGRFLTKGTKCDVCGDMFARDGNKVSLK